MISHHLNQAKQGGRGCCCCLFQTNKKLNKFQQFHLEPDHARGDGLDQELADSWDGIVFHLKKVGQSLKVETSRYCSYLLLSRNGRIVFWRKILCLKTNWNQNYSFRWKKSLPRLFRHCSHCQYFHLRPEFIFYKISQKLEMLLIVDENLQSQAHWMIKSLHFCLKIGAFHIWKWDVWPFMISQYFWK